MAMPSVVVSGHGMEVTGAIEQYIREKLQKHEVLLSDATSITVQCIQEKSSRGVKHDFRIEVVVTLPRALAKVEKDGSDINAVFDEVVDVLQRKLKRYKDKHHQWDGKRPWRVEYMDKMTSVEEPVVTDFVDYVPKIVERFKLDNCTPMTEAEAIEQMELLDQPSFLFKKKETGVFAMVYKRKRGGYALVEQCA
jgi:putative sigma-54 modulation protein